MKEIEDVDLREYARILGCEEKDVPAPLLNTHHKIRFMLDRIGSKFMPHTYVMVAALSGVPVIGFDETPKKEQTKRSAARIVPPVAELAGNDPLPAPPLPPKMKG